MKRNPDPTFKDVSVGAWAKTGFLLPDDRRVIALASGPVNGRNSGRILFHVCIDDGTCRSGKANDKVLTS